MMVMIMIMIERRIRMTRMMIAMTIEMIGIYRKVREMQRNLLRILRFNCSNSLCWGSM